MFLKRSSIASILNNFNCNELVGRISSNDVKTLAKLNISSASQLLVSEGDRPEVTEPSNLDVVVEGRHLMPMFGKVRAGFQHLTKLL